MHREFLFLLTLFFCVTLIFSPAHAARFTGEYLMQMCSKDGQGREVVPGGHIACQAYIAGILDYHNLIRSLGTAPSVDFCVPEDAGLNEIQRKVESYIFHNKSEHKSFIASPGVALALYTAYPCPK